MGKRYSEIRGDCMITANEFNIMWKKWDGSICRNKLSGEIRRYKVVGEFVKIF